MRLFAQWKANWYADPQIQNPDEALDNVTLDVLAQRYLEYADKYYRQDGHPTGEASNIYYALKPLVDVFGPVNAHELRPRHLKAYQHQLIELNMARTTINARVNIVRRMIKWAVGEELIGPEVLAGAQAVPSLKRGRSDAKESNPVMPVHEDLVNMTIGFCYPTVASMIRLHWLTGMRPCEVCRMRPCDIKTNVTIALDNKRDIETWVYEPVAHKTAYRGQIRRVFLGPEARSVVEPFMTRDTQAYLFTPEESVKQMQNARHQARKTPLSCGHKPGSNCKGTRKFRPRYTTTGYGQAIRHACNAACKAEGIPKNEWKKWHWSPNQLRHAALTRIANSMATEQARVVAGHKSARTTEIYLKLFDRDEREAANVMEKVG